MHTHTIEVQAICSMQPRYSLITILHPIHYGHLNLDENEGYGLLDYNVV
jgi:hypothetical protein